MEDSIKSFGQLTCNPHTQRQLYCATKMSGRASSPTLMIPELALLPAIDGKELDGGHLSLTHVTILLQTSGGASSPMLSSSFYLALSPPLSVRDIVLLRQGVGSSLPSAVDGEGQGEFSCSHIPQPVLLPAAGGEGRGRRKIAHCHPHHCRGDCFHASRASSPMMLR